MKPGGTFSDVTSKHNATKRKNYEPKKATSNHAEKDERRDG